MAPHPLVLCLQDTTELDYNGQQMQGLGPLSYEAQRGNLDVYSVQELHAQLTH